MKQLRLITGFDCDNRCIYCNQFRQNLSGRNSFEQLIATMKAFKPPRYDAISLTGGEVLIRPDVIALVNKARLLGYKTIQIQSNGNKLKSPKFVEQLAAAGVTHFAISLCSHDEDTHDLLSGRIGAYKNVIQGLRNIISLNLSLSTITVIVQQNYKQTIDIVLLLRELGVKIFQFGLVNPLSHGYEELVPDIKEAIKFIKKGLLLGRQFGMKGSTEDIPACLLGKDFYFQEVPQDVVREGHQQYLRGDYHSHIRLPQCMKCKAKKNCLGVSKFLPKYIDATQLVPVK